MSGGSWFKPVKELSHFPNPKHTKKLPVPFHEARHATNYVCGFLKNPLQMGIEVEFLSLIHI